MLFLGLAATFGSLSFVPVRTAHHTERMKWPLIPAAVLAVLGAVFVLQSIAQLNPTDFAVPTVMVLAGIILIIYAYFARHGQAAEGPGIQWRLTRRTGRD